MAKHAQTRRRPNPVLKFLNTPKGWALVTLVVLAAVALIAKQFDVPSVRTLGVGVVTGFVVDLIVGMFYKRKRFISDGGIITGLIVGMVLSSFTPWYFTAATTAIALVSKHILRVKRKPIFNPAALGLLVANYAFSSMESWWGGMSLLSGWFIIVVVVGGALVARRAKKLPQVIAFLVTYALLCAVMLLFKQTHDNATYAFQVPFSNSVLFLAFFMLTDPPTSPAKMRDQLWFGCLTGIISVGVYFTVGGLVYLLIGLLVANAVKYVHSQWFSRRVTRVSTGVAQAE